MSFIVEVEELANDAAVCRLHGSLDAGTAPDFEEAVLPLSGKIPAGRIVLDMTNLDYIASAGLRVLLKLVKEAGERKVELFGVGVEGTVRSVLKMTGFFRYIKDFASIEDCFS